jgi:diphthine synthase
MTRAVSEGIRTHMIHGASAVTATVGECGMHYYKVGRIATIMNNAKSVGTPYYVIHRNLVEGNHTVLLLEYNHEEGFFLGPGDALALLVGEEAEQRRNVIRPDTFAVVASRVGTPEAAITGGQISHLAERDFGGPPHSIIIPGRMHFTESDALRAVADCIDEPLDNSRSAEKVSVQMIKKYAPMIRKAISDAEPYRASAGAALVLENAECYMQDAMRFLEQGKDDLAVLSIGYADGLLDALRMVRDAEPGGAAA